MRGVCGCHRCLEAERTVCLPEVLHGGSSVFAVGVVPRPPSTRIPKSADDFGILSRSSASVDVGPVDTTCRLD